MTEEANQQVETAKGLPEGVSTANLDEGQGREGAPQAPVVDNSAPVKEAAAKAAEEQAASKEAAEEKKPEEKTEENKNAEETPAEAVEEGDEILEDYTSYDDPVADSAVSMLKELGVSVADSDKIFREAAISGDMSKIDIATLTEKVGKEKATVIVAAVSDYLGRTHAAVKESVNAVYEELGGKNNWNKVLTWSQEQKKTNPQFLKQSTELNEMFNLNKTSAKFAAQELKRLYEADPNNSSLVIEQVSGDSAGTDSSAEFTPLSRNEYLEKIKVAHEKNDKEEITRLRAQRNYTRQNYKN